MSQPRPVCAETGAWTSGGPYGGDVLTLAVDPKTPTTLYAGTFTNGVFKSIDSGITWFRLTPVSGSTLVINPLSPAILYLGYGSGVLKSTDAGATWAAADIGLTGQGVSVLAIDPRAPATLYAGTDGGVFRSTDAGASRLPCGKRVWLT